VDGWLRTALVAALVLYAAANRDLIPRGLTGHGVLFTLPFALAALACWRRSRRPTADRAAWLAQSVALGCFVAGNVYSTAVNGDTMVYPSPADALWLSFYPCTYVAIALFAKANLREFLPSTWLDGAIGGFGAAALAITFVLAPALTTTSGSLSVVATNLAYPVADIVLLVTLVAVGTALRHSGPPMWMLLVGIVLFFVGDCYFLYSNATGTYVPNANPLELTWSLGVTTIGLAATSTTGPGSTSSRTGFRYLIPSTFAVGTIALLVHGQAHPLPPSVVALTMVTLVLTAARVVLTVREVQALSASRTEARTDYLTRLPNRRHLAEELTTALDDRHVPTSVLVIDLDRFKEVNDSLGHLAGDQLLTKVSARLEAAVGESAVLARLGGDEFAVVLPGLGSAGATQAAEDIRAALQEPFNLSGIPVAVQASIGVASAPEHGNSAEEVLAYADIAMYQAKRTSEGVATFRVADDNPSRDRLELLAGLPHAITEGQLVVHYQPQVDGLTSRTCGIEALVRWQHPTRGLLAPAAFLPMIAETQLMRALTHVVLAKAVSDWRDLKRRGFSTSLSVNVSAIDLNPDFVAEIRRLIDSGEIEPDVLILEITEEALIADRRRTSELLAFLRGLGVRVSVDDYGTGRASLAYLRDLPLDEIKLDRRFLAGVPADAHNSAIVLSTIDLAHRLGLPIVTEGVETEETLSWLDAHGRPIYQGYQIARPMPKATLIEWLTARDEAGTPAAAP
jgi:diguanylate cyclase (GGDEF)-like protein